MIKRLLFFFLPAVVFAATAQTQSVTMTINAAKTGAPISPYVYGQFIEPIGNIINHGLWAEMLDDRKFYAPVVAIAPEPVAEPARFGREPLRRWTAVRPIESVVMDSTRPYVGEHSPLVKLDGTEPRGIRQAGLAVRKGKVYMGRIVLAADSGVSVAVSLVGEPTRTSARQFPLRSCAQAIALRRVSLCRRQLRFRLRVDRCHRRPRPAAAALGLRVEFCPAKRCRHG